MSKSVKGQAKPSSAEEDMFFTPREQGSDLSSYRSDDKAPSDADFFTPRMDEKHSQAEEKGVDRDYYYEESLKARYKEEKEDVYFGMEHREATTTGFLAENFVTILSFAHLYWLAMIEEAFSCVRHGRNTRLSELFDQGSSLLLLFSLSSFHRSLPA